MYERFFFQIHICLLMCYRLINERVHHMYKYAGTCKYTVNYRHYAHAHNNAHPPKIQKYRSKILYLTYGRYNAHPLKIQFLNLQAHGRYGGRLQYYFGLMNNNVHVNRSQSIAALNDEIQWNIERHMPKSYSEPQKENRCVRLVWWSPLKLTIKHNVR